MFEIIVSLYITIISIIRIIIAIYFYFKNVKSYFEKTAFFIFIGAFCLPIILYYLDKYNIPTLLGQTNNINIQNWLSFLGTYSSTIISAIIGATFLLFVTKTQIISNRNDMDFRDKENLRIQHLPLLQYQISGNKVGFQNQNNYSLNTKSKGEGKNQAICLIIENIGLNTAKKCHIKINSKILTEEYFEEIGPQSAIAKDSKKIIQFALNLAPDSYKFDIDIFYQDLFSNWYQQTIVLTYQLTESSKTNIEFQVQEEKQIEKFPDKKRKGE